MNISRRSFAASTLAAAASLAFLPKKSKAATTTYRLASNLQGTHPILTRLQQASEAISKESQGAIDVRIFPNSSLGGDLEILSQLRSGAIQFYPLAGAQISNFVPIASLNGIGFAFNNTSDVMKAMDGDVGLLIRDALNKSGLYAFDKVFESGFRQITSNSRPIVKPEDLKALPIRVPPSPLSTSLFKALNASPQSINFGEVYTALQTKLVDAQENPLVLVDTNKFYEVQKYVSLTNHMWDGFWLLANNRFWEKLPSDHKTVLTKHFDAAILGERADIAEANTKVVEKLKNFGMTFVTPDQAEFKKALAATSFYKEWKEKFGESAWSTLEKYAGKLG